MLIHIPTVPTKKAPDFLRKEVKFNGTFCVLKKLQDTDNNLKQYDIYYRVSLK